MYINLWILNGCRIGSIAHLSPPSFIVASQSTLACIPQHFCSSNPLQHLLINSLHFTAGYLNHNGEDGAPKERTKSNSDEEFLCRET